MTATTAAVRASRWPRRQRAFTKAVAVGAAVGLLAASGLAVFSGATSSPDAVTSPEAASVAGEREALLAYEGAVEAAVQEGGFAVTQGMQPGVADIAEGAFPDETLVTMASGWLATMEHVRTALASVAPPAFVEETARLYGEALAAYVEVAEALLAAARASGTERAELIEAVPPLGQRADELWDRAEAEFDRHRARLRLPGTGGPT